MVNPKKDKPPHRGTRPKHSLQNTHKVYCDRCECSYNVPNNRNGDQLLNVGEYSAEYSPYFRNKPFSPILPVRTIFSPIPVSSFSSFWNSFPAPIISKTTSHSFPNYHDCKRQPLQLTGRFYHHSHQASPARRYFTFTAKISMEANP